MILNIYAQGSKSLGLGHLSRVITLYHELKCHNTNINVFLHGDDEGATYLKINNVPFILLSEIDFKIKNSIIWIIDSTDIYEKDIEELISSAKIKILLSPKFNPTKISLISHAILRSDPFNLHIKNKYISKNYFIYNRGDFEESQTKTSVGIALTGSDSKNSINKIVNLLINDSSISYYIDKLIVFLGSTTNIDFYRKNIESKGLDIEYISSLRSIWGFKRDLDILIVGNGIIVDECIIENQNFILYNNNNQNDVIKSFNVEYVKNFEAKNIDALIQKLKVFCQQKIYVERTGIENTRLSSDTLPIIKKIIEIIEPDS